MFGRRYGISFELRLKLFSSRSSFIGFFLKKLSAPLFKRQKMESNLVNFTKLEPLMDNWTAIVQVIEKKKVQVSRNGKRYQKLVFVDSQGQTAQALIYAGDIMFFRKYFEPYRRYYVSNARIQNVLPRYSTYPNECSWTIDNSMLVQEINEEIKKSIMCLTLLTTIQFISTLNN
ncbi:unnamed protein product [Coffea canephora]|uniref:DUF223 domain-containing protein n=1 Tax=Coffea canephora TaxID=49390 RepID=A0A068UQ13_COFCA|nr:unnamed protein product [Coffea canephora]